MLLRVIPVGTRTNYGQLWVIYIKVACGLRRSPYCKAKVITTATLLSTAPIGVNYNSWSASSTLPSAADAGNYFYLPALGWYSSGQLYYVGDYGNYWSSSANPWYSLNAYCLGFGSGYVNVSNNDRSYGYRVGGFE